MTTNELIHPRLHLLESEVKFVSKSFGKRLFPVVIDYVCLQ